MTEIAEPGNPITNPTQDRPANRAEADRGLGFLPNKALKGLGPSDNGSPTSRQPGRAPRAGQAGASTWIARLATISRVFAP